MFNKTVILVILLCLLALPMTFWALTDLEATANTSNINAYEGGLFGLSSSNSTIWVPDNYTMIQEAINAASFGDTVYVRAATYYEDVVVNQTILLIGEDPETTILDGKVESPRILGVVASDVVISNFTIQNTRVDLPAYGVSIKDSQNVTLNNVIVKNCYTGIWLYNASHCEMLNNIIVNNTFNGIDLPSGSSNNSIVSNSIILNTKGLLIQAPTCQNNTFYHNNFVNNTIQIEVLWAGPNTSWDNGTEGNYWSDYTGEDDGSGGRVAGDGIGDTEIPWLGVDNYPLMEPWGPLPPIPPVARFSYSPESPVVEETVTFDASTSYDPYGSSLSYRWDFGDGAYDPEYSPKGNITTHAYNATGNYNVTLTVKKDPNGLTSNITKTITIQKMSSNITINIYPQIVEVGSNVTISGIITDQHENPRPWENITIRYLFYPFGTWTMLATVKTQHDSSYNFVWTTTEAGTYVLLNASWLGDDKTLGAEGIVLLGINKATSKITIDVEPETVKVGSNVTIKGSIDPTRENVNVSIQFYAVGELNPVVVVVKTDTDGFYSYTWKTSEVGTYEIEARWDGDRNTLSAETETKAVEVEAEAPPVNIIPYVIVVTVIVIALAFSVYFILKKRR
ncbi:MAG: PKD domain-containing protein [Candidatus Bathyarchaeota archaeon]|nr:PKD domain-containing protein [Candidatus Bathyarchaeota archaeon]